MNYERLIQWIAGPFAVLIGYAATKIVHANISHNAAVNVATFILGTLAVIAPHIKWLNNLPKWWQESGIAEVAGEFESADGATPSSLPSEAKYVNQAPNEQTLPVAPDRSGIPTDDGPYKDSATDIGSTVDERTNTSTENAVKSDESDSVPAAAPQLDAPAPIVAPAPVEPPAPEPPVTGVTGVTDLGDSAPINPDSSDIEKLRAQLRQAGLTPEA